MLSTILVKMLESNSYQACWRHSQSSALVLHLLSEVDRSKIDHKFSIGLRSGLCDGQSSWGIRISCMARRVLIAVSFGSLSCLNPIENLWSILDWSISDRRCNTKAELWECLQQAWYEFDSSILTKLVESMPRRLHAVIDNKLMVWTKTIAQCFAVTTNKTWGYGYVGSTLVKYIISH